MNLKVPGAILPLGCAILSTRAKTARGVGTIPLRRTRVKLQRVTYVVASRGVLTMKRGTGVRGCEALSPFHALSAVP